MRVILKRKDGKEANIQLTTDDVGNAGVIQNEHRYFTFQRFQGNSIVFEEVDGLLLDDDEIGWGD